MFLEDPGVRGYDCADKLIDGLMMTVRLRIMRHFLPPVLWLFFFCFARAENSPSLPPRGAVDPAIASRISEIRTRVVDETNVVKMSVAGDVVRTTPVQSGTPVGVAVSNGVAIIPYVKSAVPLRVHAVPGNEGPDAERLNLTMAVVAQKNEEWTRTRHDLIYGDPELKQLHDRIARLEKELLDLRQALDTKLATRPDMAQAEQEREKAFRALADAQQHRTLPATGTTP